MAVGRLAAWFLSLPCPFSLVSIGILGCSDPGWLLGCLSVRFLGWLCFYSWVFSLCFGWLIWAAALASMATEDCKELLTSGSQPDNVENDLYNDVNITAILITGEKKGDTALEDDKMAEVVNVNAVQEIAAEISTAIVDGHEKADEVGGNDVENGKKVEAVNSSPNTETKKIVRKRKKNAEEASAHTVSSSPMTTKRKTNDAIPEDDVEEADSKDVDVGKKVEGAVNKSVKVAKKKIVANVKGGSSNAGSAPTKSPNVAAVEDTYGIEENAEQNIEVDENHASATKNATPAIEKKDAEGTKGKNIKKRKKRAAGSSSSFNANKVNTADKPSPSASGKHLKKDGTAEKILKKVDGMGLIFMCNAKTKKDCFKYNVFGLPESKKALVAKIYKGMRLFLFDFDLKLLYGIYKAAGPGGYNIEPKAFNSKFPSQVRFTVLRDCLPLPEEKFKAAIKENYVRNKFDCQLSAEQVRKLCKLFQNPTSSVSIQKHRPRAGREVTVPSSRRRELKHRHERRETYPLPPPRVLHLSPPPQALPLHTIPRALPAPPLPSYTYERPGDDYYYRRERHRVLDLEMRPRDLPIIDYHDPYNPYREHVLYREPAYPPSFSAAYAARLREPRTPPRYLY
ncbi:hypothetical protein IEQ34_012951 [Dendrobium chrysotoxum]|uniref:DCD domain-containing protein n=1 Tax=Dendrobium chrysotoxum TaxID=161865 RepID=A0AAV7GM38_DENCH|nr:hypothetical protein IEQ34_012951 [Dendrobium chrysotoxum]